MTNEQQLVAAIIALAGAVSVLWYRFEQSRLKCEADRDALWAALTEATGKAKCNAHQKASDLTPQAGGT